MCPSYRATGEENDSTRGRARILQEMLRGETVQDGWRSTEVRDALDLCLSCKACSTDCPVGVDMATYKAEFLHQHYRGRIRPRSHYSLGWLPLTSVARRLRRPAAQRPAARTARHGCSPGSAASPPEAPIPAFASRRALRSVLRRSTHRRTADGLLFVDSFTRAFRPEVAGAASRVLADAGIPSARRRTVCAAA